MSTRKGYTKIFGNKLLVHLNWSKSWDGWGITDNTNNRKTLKILALEHSTGSPGSLFTVIVWRFLFIVGVPKAD